MGVGMIFSRGGAKWIFPSVAKNIFPGGPNVAKLDFTHSKLRRPLLQKI